VKPTPEDSPRTLRGTLSLARDVVGSLRRAFAMIWETDARLTAALAALSVVAALIPAGVAFVARRILDGIVRAALSGSAQDRAAVLRDLALELALGLLAVAVRRTSQVVESLLHARFSAHVNERILEKALGLGLEDFEDPDTLDELNRARKGASYRPLDMVQGIFGLGQSLLTLVAYGGLMVSVAGWTLALVALAAVPEFIVQTRFARDGFRLFNWRTPEMRRQQYYESVLTDPEAVKEVRLFGLGPPLLARHRELFWRFWREDRNLTLRRGAWGAALEALSALAYYSAYVGVALKAMTGALTVGDLGLFAGVFRDAQGLVGHVLHTVGRAYEDHLYLTALHAFLDRPPKAPPDGAATEGPRPDDGLRFENVSFAYPGAEKPVLQDVTLHLPPGHKLALVGENGAGKTTLIKLLTRLYRPTAGRVLLDGLDLNAWREDALRRRVGVIFQDFVQYQLLVGENIGVGDVAHLDDAARWREAAAQGLADTFIDALPKGYETQLGRWFADGQELSLGQWQKVALSRAFMRRDADILVLDEPTASMDAAAEAQVFDRFRMLTEHRMAVLISHRFSTVRMADSIALLADGRIAEHGTHDELLARGGRYAELFFLQARGYR
jgi:ATP-binding cassette subfamily B protein